MLKKTLTYKDYNEEEVTEDLFFNLSPDELIELEVSHEGGFTAALQRIVDADDSAAIIKEMKNILLMSYGKKSADGRRFIKNDTLIEEFRSSKAYSVLFLELATDAVAAAHFMNGLVPTEDIEKLEAKQAFQAAQGKPPRILEPKDPETMSLADFVKLDSFELPKAQARIANGELRILS